MTTKEQLCEDLKNILRAYGYTGSDVDNLTPDSTNNLTCLQIDDIDRMCMLYELNKKYNNALTDEDVFGLETGLSNAEFNQFLIALCDKINQNLH